MVGRERCWRGRALARPAPLLSSLSTFDPVAVGTEHLEKLGVCNGLSVPFGGAHGPDVRRTSAVHMVNL